MALGPVVELATISDVPGIVDLFTDTVHRVNRRDYSPEQLAAWAPRPPDLARWRSRFEDGRTTWVARVDGALSGFVELADPEQLDCLYVAADRQGHGIATALLTVAEAEARRAGARVLRTEASITARPFFSRRGFDDPVRQTVVVRGVPMDNFRMTKALD